MLNALICFSFFVALSFCPTQPKDTLKSKPPPEALKRMVEQLVQPAKNNDTEIGIDGLLVDDTRTRMGKDFYDLFYTNWEAPPKAKDFTITISERPFRITTTMVLISINENTVFQQILQPRQEIIEALALDAVAITRDYLTNYEEIMRQLNGEDMEGSGIY